MDYKTSVLIYRELKKRLKECLSHYDIKIVLAGSVAKQTSIDFTELDVQVIYKLKDYSLFITELFSIFENKKYKEYTSYTYNYIEHPYITIKYLEKISIDIVPFNKFQKKGTMMASIHHLKFVKKNFTKEML